MRLVRRVDVAERVHVVAGVPNQLRLSCGLGRRVCAYHELERPDGTQPRHDQFAAWERCCIIRRSLLFERVFDEMHVQLVADAFGPLLVGLYRLHIHCLLSKGGQQFPQLVLHHLIVPHCVLVHILLPGEDLQKFRALVGEGEECREEEGETGALHVATKHLEQQIFAQYVVLDRSETFYRMKENIYLTSKNIQ